MTMFKFLRPPKFWRRVILMIEAIGGDGTKLESSVERFCCGESTLNQILLYESLLNFDFRTKNLQPAVNRQPGYRRGDREVVGRDYIIFSLKKSIFLSHKYF